MRIMTIAVFLGMQMVAGAALAQTAAEARALTAESVAQHIEQRCRRVDLH